MSAQQKLRCAVYTRKSTEEGLEQEFNSLDAQREACAAFIASQAGLGWKLVPHHYDDGGISGGTMERPSLQRLLQDIRERRIDVVVVYKIDRLTRSLMDFSKIVETFDTHNVSVVSVTQQFNTTTSMGRLTLNVLLSFAQFEREVTAERIRDKIAASRKKGIWMGGTVPFGYRAVDKKLVVDEVAAAKVRSIFSRYVELKSVLALADELNRAGDGAETSTPVSRGRLYHLLSNPVYIGKARHRGTSYNGTHQPIVNEDLFANVQMLLRDQGPQRRSQTNARDLHALTGIVFDETGDRLSPAYATNHGKRYRYYISNRLKVARRKDDAGWRIAADELETNVKLQFAKILEDKSGLAEWIERYASKDQIASGLLAAERLQKNNALPISRGVLKRVIISPEALSIEIDTAALVSMLAPGPAGMQRADPASVHIATVPAKVHRRRNEARLIIGNERRQGRGADPKLVALLARAHWFLEKLTDGNGRSISDLSKSTGMHRADISRALPLAFLAPSLVKDILSGEQPVNLTSRRLARLANLPILWRDQHRALGL